MIKDNQSILNRLFVFLDALIIGGSFILAYVIKFYLLNNGPGEGVLPLISYVYVAPFLMVGYILVYYLSSVYTPKRTQRLPQEIGNLFRANVVCLVVLVIVLFVIIHNRPYARSVIAIFFVLENILTGGLRIALRKSMQKFRKSGYNLKHILLVGYSRAAEGYMDRIRENPQWGYEPIGVLDDHVPVDVEYHGVKIIGKIERLEEILRDNMLDEVSITLPLGDYEHLGEIVSICEKSGTHTKFIPDYNSLVPSKPYTEDLDGLPVINIRYVPLSNSGNSLIKRLVDIIGSMVGIILTSPIMLVSAILVKCSSQGPIIFKQERVGLQGKSFYMYKFRSMKVQSDSAEKKGWTTQNDPRVTKVGKFLRKTSIDELPQLFNILKGDMSLVGPRPERPQFVEKFREDIPRYMVKHQVRPGLTGWAQVNGLRGDTSIKRRIEYDIYYIENWTFWFDLRIIFLTFFTGFINKNAY